MNQRLVVTLGASGYVSCVLADDDALAVAAGPCADPDQARDLALSKLGQGIRRTWETPAHGRDPVPA